MLRVRNQNELEMSASFWAALKRPRDVEGHVALVNSHVSETTPQPAPKPSDGLAAVEPRCSCPRCIACTNLIRSDVTAKNSEQTPLWCRSPAVVDVAAVKYVAPLKCPLTRRVPVHPARFVGCRHIETFELWEFLHQQLWRLSDYAFDDFLCGRVAVAHSPEDDAPRAVVWRCPCCGGQAFPVVGVPCCVLDTALETAIRSALGSEPTAATCDTVFEVEYSNASYSVRRKRISAPTQTLRNQLHVARHTRGSTVIVDED